MFCENCGSKIEENGKFCDKCGSPIDVSSSNSNPKTNDVKINHVKTKDVKVSKKVEQKKPMSKSVKSVIGLLIGGILIIGNILMAKIIFFDRNESLESSINQQEDDSKNNDDNKKEDNNDLEKDDTEIKENDTEEKENDTEIKENDTEEKENDTENKKDDKKTQEEKKEYKHTYKVIQSNLNWDEAKKYCESLDGHLATITSKEEEETVLNLLKETDIKVSWLGATDLNAKGTFAWVNGEDFTYSNWAPNEPNNDQGIEHYLVLYKVEDEWTWNDGPVNTNEYYKAENIGFVCEWEEEVE